MYAPTTTSDDELQLSPRVERVFSSYQRYNKLQQEDNVIKEHFNDLQSKLQELNVLHQPSVDLYHKTTPSSRDSSIPIPSSTFDEASLSKHSLETITPMMSAVYNSTPRHQSYTRNVHWNDESVSPSRKENVYHISDLTTIKKNGRHIILNASLPFHSKLNIRIQGNRVHSNEHNEVKAIASIQRLDPQREHEYIEALRRTYLQHYSTQLPNESIIISPSIRYEKLPRHHQISLPVSLPIDQRLFIYIRNGEVFARL